MPPFTVNPARVDPYKNFKFRVVWDGRPVAGVSRISGLVRMTEVVAHREGGDPSVAHLSPGQTSFAPIRLERGLTHDTAFEAWASSVWRAGAPRGAEMGLADFRKNIRIELFNEAGQLVLAWMVFRCWVSEYQALPELDAGANAVAIEAITLQHEGFERDAEVQEPAEPPTGKG
jgi:phage tail-like protein